MSKIESILICKRDMSSVEAHCATSTTVAMSRCQPLMGLTLSGLCKPWSSTNQCARSNPFIGSWSDIVSGCFEEFISMSFSRKTLIH